PLPRAVQPPAHPAARRLGTARTGAAGTVAAAVVSVPAVRLPGAVRARVLDRRDLEAPRSLPQPTLRLRVPMKLRHLAGRFTRALWPGPPRPDDVAWVESILTPDGFVQFRR